MFGFYFLQRSIPQSTHNAKKLILEKGSATLEQSRYAQYILELADFRKIKDSADDFDFFFL